MAEENRQNFLHGAAILAAGVAIMKILGAIYKIPLQNIIGDIGYGYFFAAYNIYNVLLTISTAGLPVALSRMISEANTLGRPMQARRTFRIAMTTLAVIGAVFSLAMFLFPTEMAILYKFGYDGGLSIEPHSSVWKGDLGERGIDYTIRFMKQYLI